jgi:hypothetical protein
MLHLERTDYLKKFLHSPLLTLLLSLALRKLHLDVLPPNIAGHSLSFAKSRVFGAYLEQLVKRAIIADGVFLSFLGLIPAVLC